MKRSPWLRTGHYYDGWWDDHCHDWTCNTKLREYFKFPAKAKSIRFFVTTRPLAEAYLVEFAWSNCIKINEATIMLYDKLHDFLSDATLDNTKPVYFGLEYL